MNRPTGLVTTALAGALLVGRRRWPIVCGRLEAGPTEDGGYRVHAHLPVVEGP